MFLNKPGIDLNPFGAKTAIQIKVENELLHYGAAFSGNSKQSDENIQSCIPVIWKCQV